MIEKAKNYAISKHLSTNHYYDGKPYSYHLRMVVEIARKYIHLIPEHMRDIIIAACFCHDLIEDCRVTYNDLAKETCFDVAEIVYAVTNEKGKVRKERANDKYYEGIRNTPYATFVKLCDRIANLEHSKSSESTMLPMYRKENPNFINKIYDKHYEEMFEYLKTI